MSSQTFLMEQLEGLGLDVYAPKTSRWKAMPDDPGWGHYCRKFFKFNAARRSAGTLVRKLPGLFVDGYTCNVFWFTGFMWCRATKAAGGGQER